MSGAEISAIVCVYNRADTLPDCLDALVAQSLPADRCEVIVVDNNSTDGSRDIAETYAARHKQVRVVREEKQGLASARNRGMREATSPIAAFTDDDAVPASDWLERLLARFNALDETVAAVGGELDPVWETPRPDWLTGDKLHHALSVRLGWSRYARFLSDEEWLCEANSAYRIAPVMALGGFPENLGRIGTNLLSGENAINALLLRDGMRFFFDPEIRVQHQIARGRLTKDWFRRRFFWQGVTTYLVRKYLQENGGAVETSSVVAVPMNEKSWSGLWSEEDDDSFHEALGHVYGMGYTLAASNLLGGR